MYVNRIHLLQLRRFVMRQACICMYMHACMYVCGPVRLLQLCRLLCHGVCMYVHVSKKHSGKDISEQKRERVCVYACVYVSMITYN